MIFNNKGMTLIEVVISASIMSLSILTMVNQMNTVNQLVKKQDITQTLLLLKEEAKILITDNDSWAVTNQKNNSQTCLTKSTDCGRFKSPTQFNLFSQADAKNPRFNTGKRNAGFDVYGGNCVGFSGRRGNCPIKLILTWQAMCQSASNCINPSIRVTGEFLYDGPDLIGGLNTERFKFEILKENPIVERALASNEPDLSKIGECPRGTYIIGFHRDGSLKCGAEHYKAGSVCRGSKMCKCRTGAGCSEVPALCVGGSLVCPDDFMFDRDR